MGAKYFSFILLGFILTCFFFSCSKEENDDNTPPTFEILPLDSLAADPPSLVNGDTLYFFMNQDTIFNRIRIRLKDNKSLASYNIRIRGLKPDATDIIKDTNRVDSIQISGNDTIYAFWNKNYQSQMIFGQTDKIITQSIALDTVFKLTVLDSNGNFKSKLYPTWMKGPYQLKLSVVDVQGNETIEYFKIFLGRKGTRVLGR